MRTRILVAITVIEAVVISLLIASRAQLKLVTTQTPVTAIQNPLKQAVEYEASEAKFEELVSKYPEWVSYRTKHPGGFNWPVLADCAVLQRTNYARTLVAHGANVAEAIEVLHQVKAEDAISLLQELEAGIQAK